MNCFNCGCRLSEKDFCTGCGADVSLYKRIISVSNLYYNEGLEKANVRDLSGAVVCLRQSLKFNKNNIEARNLLGLVYHELGETFAALSEWVISKNLKAKKNVADDYIDDIQSNPSRLDAANQTIKKYNMALTYCKQESYDLATIQLKKILSVHGSYVQARQLLALLYLREEQWDKARKELLRCMKVDTNNTLTLRLLKETQVVHPEEEEKVGKKKGKPFTQEGVYQYQSGNELIIQPLNHKESTGITGFVNIIIGIAVGIAITWFLVLPARILNAKAEITEELRIVSEQTDVKTAKIVELEQQIEGLTQTNAQLQENLDNYVGTDGKMEANDSLLLAASTYLEDNAALDKTAEYLEQIEATFLEEGASENFISLYQTLLAQVGPRVSAEFYESGFAAYRQEEYTKAIVDLEKAYKFDETNGNALYNLGNSYYKSGDKEKAKEIYQQVKEKFPDTSNATKAEEYLSEIDNEG